MKKIDIYKNPKKKLNIENPKKVSFIIPNYNYEKYIIERIDSILLQTYPIYEIIILDDCSKDNSVEVINKKIENFWTVISNGLGTSVFRIRFKALPQIYRIVLKK